MSRNGVVAALVVLIAAAGLVVAVSRSDDALWPIAAGVVGIVALVVLVGIYIVDAGFRAGKAAHEIREDDRRI